MRVSGDVHTIYNEVSGDVHTIYNDIAYIRYRSENGTVWNYGQRTRS